MRRVLTMSVAVAAILAAMSAAVPAASAAGDDFAGLWERTDRELTWVITPVGEGVYSIEETFEGGQCGLTVATDTDATVVGGVLIVDWDVDTANVYDGSAFQDTINKHEPYMDQRGHLNQMLRSSRVGYHKNKTYY